MAAIVEQLNENAGVLSLLFSAVVMLATVVYAWLTKRLVDETRKLRRAQTEPRVEVALRSSPHWINFIDVYIQNIGPGPAYDLRFEIEPRSAGLGTEQLMAALQKHACFKRGLAYLGPKQEFASFWTSLTEGDSTKLKANFTVRCMYRDAAGVRYANDCPLDLSELEGSGMIGEFPLHGMAKSIEKIQKAIDSVSSGLGRLKVNIYTEQDRADETRAVHERIQEQRRKNEP